MPATSTATLPVVIGSSMHRQVAFCGPLGVGKSTAVRAGSTTPVSGSEVQFSLDAGTAAKRTTTVGIEYGEWHRDDAPPVVLYGTPGQARFSEARSGALGRRAAIVLWLFGQNDYAIAEAQEWLEFIGRDVEWSRLTVAVTRLGSPGPHPDLAEYRSLLDRYDPAIPLVAADPRDRDDVHAVVEVALRTIQDVR